MNSITPTTRKLKGILKNRTNQTEKEPTTNVEYIVVSDDDEEDNTPLRVNKGAKTLNAQTKELKKNKRN